ncbi:MAG: hypothetical protein FWG40_01085 [Peptococcaceae bacterium]|nr:hypothetical protein [Peptococcaceae bacterium]
MLRVVLSAEGRILTPGTACIGVDGDNKAETIIFELPRQIAGQDTRGFGLRISIKGADLEDRQTLIINPDYTADFEILNSVTLEGTYTYSLEFVGADGVIVHGTENAKMKVLPHLSIDQSNATPIPPDEIEGIYGAIGSLTGLIGTFTDNSAAVSAMDGRVGNLEADQMQPADTAGVSAVITLADKKIQDVTSTALASLAITAPPVVAKGYRSALTFRTQADSPPLKFSQAGVYLAGDECRGGYLLPQANKHYRINFDYARPRITTTVPPMHLLGRVSGMDFAGDFTLPENDPVKVAQLLAVAGEWHDSDLPLSYGQDTPMRPEGYAWSGAMEINCNTLAKYVLRGIGPSASQYENPSNTNTGSAPWAQNSIPDTATAAEIARWFVEQGRYYTLRAGFENVRPGDVLFFSQGPPEDHSSYGTRPYHISHVSIVDYDLSTLYGGSWSAGTLSASTGQLSGTAANRARTPEMIPVPAGDWVLLSVRYPFCFVGTHFYATSVASSWITSAALMGQDNMGQHHRCLVMVPEGASFMRIAIGKRPGAYVDMIEADYDEIALSWGRLTHYEASGPGGPIFLRALNAKNIRGLVFGARPNLGP